MASTLGVNHVKCLLLAIQRDDKAAEDVTPKQRQLAWRNDSLNRFK
jgi:hypothetical protein